MRLGRPPTRGSIQVAWSTGRLGCRHFGAERRDSLALTTGATPTDRTEDAIADPSVDAVDICLPHSLHEPVAVRALNAGKHVLCEKPLANSLEAADRMIGAACRAGKSPDDRRERPFF